MHKCMLCQLAALGDFLKLTRFLFPVSHFVCIFLSAVEITGVCRHGTLTLFFLPAAPTLSRTPRANAMFFVISCESGEESAQSDGKLRDTDAAVFCESVNICSIDSIDLE